MMKVNLIIASKSNGTNFLDYSKSGDYGNKSVYMEATLSYDRTFAEKHSVAAMLLFNRRNYDDGSKLPYRNQGLAGRASYTYSGKYVGEFNFGYNGLKILPKASVMAFSLQEPLVGLYRKRHLCNHCVKSYLN